MLGARRRRVNGACQRGVSYRSDLSAIPMAEDNRPA